MSAHGHALIVGASRGLGLCIARSLLRRGFDVTLAARDVAALERASAHLDAPGRVHTHTCDVSDRHQVETLIAACEERAPLEVVITVAGIIQVGPAEAMTLEQFDRALDVMTRGPINVAWTALPAMRARGFGRIGTVASVGGLVSPPHLLPYATAKFGAVGFSDGLAAALAGTGVTATTIAPGLMRTGSHEAALFAGDAAAEYAWFAPAASLPLLSMDADAAAERIVEGVLKGRPLVTLTPLTWLAVRVRGLAPGTTTRLMGLANRLLPKASGEPGVEISGKDAAAQVRSPLVHALTALGRRAARRNNE